MPMEFPVHSLHIALLTCMIEDGMLQEHMDELMKLEEDGFLVIFFQGVQKRHHKAWHDHHIKTRHFIQVF